MELSHWSNASALLLCENNNQLYKLLAMTVLLINTSLISIMQRRKLRHRGMMCLSQAGEQLVQCPIIRGGGQVDWPGLGFVPSSRARCWECFSCKQTTWTWLESKVVPQSESKALLTEVEKSNAQQLLWTKLCPRKRHRLNPYPPMWPYLESLKRQLKLNKIMRMRT